MVVAVTTVNAELAIIVNNVMINDDNHKNFNEIKDLQKINKPKV